MADEAIEQAMAERCLSAQPMSIGKLNRFAGESCRQMKALAKSQS